MVGGRDQKGESSSDRLRMELTRVPCVLQIFHNSCNIPTAPFYTSSTLLWVLTFLFACVSNVCFFRCLSIAHTLAHTENSPEKDSTPPLADLTLQLLCRMSSNSWTSAAMSVELLGNTWLVGGTTFLACIVTIWWFTARKNIIDRDSTLRPFLKSVPVACNDLLQAARAATDAPTDPIQKDVVRINLLGKPTIITSNPEWVQQFMLTNTKNYEQRMGDPEGLADLGMLNTGVIWNNDTHHPACGWEITRGIFNKSLDTSTLQAAALIGVEQVHNVFDAALLSRATSAPDDLLDLLRRITLRITLACFFGLDITTKDEAGNLLPLAATPLVTSTSSMTEDHIIKCVVEYFAAWNYLLLRPRRLRDAEEPRHLAAVQALQHVARTLWEAAKVQSPPTAFIAGLAAMEAPTEHHLIQNCLEMLLAGTDTSSVTMFYGLTALAQYPDLQARLRAELIGTFASAVSAPLSDAIVSGSTQSEIQASVWARLQQASLKAPLLESLLLETLRFKPVGPVSIRRAVKADILPDGTAFPAGGHVIVHLEAMHFTPELFSNPTTFDTTRNLTSSNGNSMFAPFGKGTKGCPGQFLAMMEMKAIIAAFVLKYEVRQASGVSLRDMETH
jgi:aromatase